MSSKYACTQTVVGEQISDSHQAQTSCGFAVPYLAIKQDVGDPSKQIPYLEDRHTLGHWAGKRILAGDMDDYRSKWNFQSLDGLPGLRIARQDAGERLLWYGDLKSQFRKWHGTELVLVALLSAIMTVLSMYILGLTTLPNPVEWMSVK